MSISEADPTLKNAADSLVRATDGKSPDCVSARELQMVFAAVVRTYAMKIDNGETLAAFTSADRVTATDVAISASAMLAAVEMAAFELGMWQAIKGNA